MIGRGISLPRQRCQQIPVALAHNMSADTFPHETVSPKKDLCSEKDLEFVRNSEPKLHKLPALKNYINIICPIKVTIYILHDLWNNL